MKKNTVTGVLLGLCFTLVTYTFAQISGGPLSGILTAPAISSLPSGASLVGTELIPMVQSGTAYTTTPSAIATYVGGAVTASTAANLSGTTVGSLPYQSGSAITSYLSDVAVGSYLRSGGTNTAPLWSSTTLPSLATLGDTWYASAANSMASVAGNITVQPQTLCQTGTGTVSAAPVWCNYQATLIQSGLPFGMPSNGYMDNKGNFVIGAAPATSGTAVLSQTSGTAYVTFSAATLAGTSAGDVGRVLTVQEGSNPNFTYNSFTTSLFLSTTAAQGTISGTGTLPPNTGTVTGVAITNTAGAFSCTCTNLLVGQGLTLSGTYGGTGSITGYANPTIYYVSATNGTSTFTLQSAPGTAIVTTTGTPTGITYTVNGTTTVANAAMYLTSGWPGAVATGGGVTFPAPLTFLYPNAYLYFPASSPTTVASLFYCVPFSTAAGTCYNNAVSSGTLTIPTSPTAFSGLTAGAYSQTTGAVALLTYTVPGNTLGVNGCLDYDFAYSNDNSAGNKTASFRHAAGAGGVGQAVTTQTVGRTFGKVCNAGSASVQVNEAYLTGATAVTASVYSNGSTVGHYAIAMSSNQISGFLINLATATDSAFFEYASLKLTAN